MTVFNNALAGAAGQSGGAADYKIERSLRFHSGDTGFLNFSPSSSGPRTAWTFSAWVKRTKFGVTNQPIFGAQNGSNRETLIAFNSNDSLRFSDTGDDQSTYRVDLHTSMKFRDPSAWYHICVTWAANQYQQDKARIYVNGLEITAFDTETFSLGLHDNSYVNGANVNHYIGKYVNYQNQATYGDMYIAEAHFIAGRSPNTATDDASGSVTGTPNAKYLTEFGEFDEDTGVWNPVEYDGTYGTGGFYLDFSDNSSNATLGTDSSGNNNTWTVNNLVGGGGPNYASSSNWTQIGNGLASGTSYNNAWDGNTSSTFLNFLTNTGGNNDVAYTFPGNGVSVSSYVRLYVGAHSNNERQWRVNSESYQSNNTTGYLQYNFSGTLTSIDGYNTWAGGNSIQLYAVEVDGTVLTSDPPETVDSLLDSPTNYDDGTDIGGNYSTWNLLSNGLGGTLANGNLDLSGSSGLNTRINSTIGVSSGKWYYEVVVTALTSSSSFSSFGIGQNNIINYYPGYDALSYAYHVENNFPMHNDTNGANIGGNFAVGDTLMVAFDLENNKLYFGKNGTWFNSGNPVTGANPVYTIAAGTYHAIARPNPSGYGSGAEFATNFGARGFSYAPPTGFKSLCTQNLDDPLIEDPSTAFNTRIWSGDANTSRALTGLNMAPDLVWIKKRSGTFSHYLFDTIRGNTKQLKSDSSDAESTTTNKLISFDSDGFTVGNAGAVNGSGDSYVGWAWEGGDLVTNSAYNQSDVWSSRCTGTIYNASLGYQNAFDGSTSTGSHSANGNTITFTPATAIPVSSSIKIYYDIGSITGTSGSADITINGTSYVATAHSNRSNGHFTVTGVSSITSMVWERAADNDLIAVKAIEVDGKILVDTGVIPVGSLNSSVYNFQNWTNNISSTSGITSGHEARLFNGILTGSGADIQSSSNGVNGVINFTNAITGSKIEVFTLGNVGQIGINGNNLTVTSLQWVDTGVTSLTSIETRCPSAGNIQNLCGLRVDGKILVDSGLSVTNVPTIPSTVRANPTAGISIGKFTGTANIGTVGTGLSNTKLVFLKNRDSSSNWVVYYTLVDGSYDYMYLNSTNGGANSSHDHAMTNTFKVGTNTDTNASGNDYSFLAFSPVADYCAMGTYIGNGASGYPNADGPFISLGFRPAWVLWKCTSQAENWTIYDSARGPFNYIDNKLLANSSAAESTNANHEIDFLSNGFKVRNNNGEFNQNSATYIYIAFAEHPFKYARAR